MKQGKQNTRKPLNKPGLQENNFHYQLGKGRILVDNYGMSIESEIWT